MNNINKMISYCGIICTECPGFIATQNNDDEQRKKIAEDWSKNYNVDVKPDDVNCDGCLSDSGRLIGHCQVCEIRKCASEKNINNCANGAQAGVEGGFHFFFNGKKAAFA